MDQGEVYVLTSPRNKIFIGKAVCFRANGDKHGAYGRWNIHKADASAAGGGHCTNLNEEIRYHEFKGFEVTVLCTVPIDELEKMKMFYVEAYEKTTDPADFLNVQKGGGTTGPLALSTRAKMSVNRQENPCFQQPHREDSKQQIREALIDNVVRYGHDGRLCPKYVKYTKHADRLGYELVSHPTIKNKSFTSKNKTLDTLYDECIVYMSTASHDVVGINNRKAARSNAVK